MRPCVASSASFLSLTPYSLARMIQYKALLALQLGIDQAAPANGAPGGGGDRKAFNSALIELMEVCRDE